MDVVIEHSMSLGASCSITSYSQADLYRGIEYNELFQQWDQLVLLSGCILHWSKMPDWLLLFLCCPVFCHWNASNSQFSSLRLTSTMPTLWYQCIAKEMEDKGNKGTDDNEKLSCGGVFWYWMVYCCMSYVLTNCFYLLLIIYRWQWQPRRGPQGHCHWWQWWQQYSWL